MSEIIRLESITKKFGKVIAVNNVNLSIENGEIHSIIGENGAGKTTLMRLLYGMYKLDSGSMFLRNESVRFSSPKDAIENKIGMVHQNFMLIDDFTVYENVVLGLEPRKFLSFDRTLAREKVRKLAEEYEMEVDIDWLVGKISVGLQQKVEILKLLYRNSNILIFDEPTAVLTPQESDALFQIFQKFKDSEKTVIFISHKLKEVKKVSDRVSVMRNGNLLKTFINKNLSEEQLAEMIAGRKISKTIPIRTKIGKAILKTENLTILGNKRIPKVKKMSFEVKSGEIVGIAGVVGNGQSELEEAVSGMRKISSGKMIFNGKDATRMSVRERRELGMVYIPEDRIRTGLAPLASIRDNLVMGHQNEKFFLGSLEFIKRSSVRAFAEESVKSYEIVCKSIEEQVGTLSGGNMQKVVIAREFSQNVSFLMISQPTRGVDVRGIEFIHKKILDMKKSGGAVLLISADLDEILALSDRILVMYEGQIIYSTSIQDAVSKKIGLAMLGIRS